MIIQAKYFNKEIMSNKKLVSFDADGTLVESKTQMSPSMAEAFNLLLEKYLVNVISGGKYSIFEDNILTQITTDNNLLKKLTLSPTCGAVMYVHNNKSWTHSYKDALEKDTITKIFNAFDYAMKKFGHNPEALYGDIVEDRETQVTFSAYGQMAPLELKNTWDPTQEKRKEMIKYLNEKLDNLDIKIGGTTSIDITKKGINKGYGIKKLAEFYKLELSEILFIGDAIFEGGNDKPVADIGVDSIQVANVPECEKIIRKIIS